MPGIGVGLTCSKVISEALNGKAFLLKSVYDDTRFQIDIPVKIGSQPCIHKRLENYDFPPIDIGKLLKKLQTIR